jgi:hypothetical protein
MNALLPIGLLAGAYILSQSGSKPKKSSSSTQSPKAPYLSADCEWICGDTGFGGLNVAKEVFEKKVIYDPLIEKYASDPDVVTLITNEVMKKELKTCKIKAENVSINDSFNIRYRYANTFIITAFFLALSGKVSNDQLSMWLSTTFPQKLKELGLLTIGNTELNVMKMRFASIDDAAIDSIIAKTFILTPEFKELTADLLATMFVIQFSQIVNTESKNSCYKITKASYADFSGLSGVVNNFFIDQFHRFRNAVEKVNPKKY